MQKKYLVLIIFCLSWIVSCSGGGGGGSSAAPAAGNRAPVFSSSSSAGVQENSAGVAYDANASDADGNSIRFSISGPDSAVFAIEPSTGEISFINSPNFEGPSDADTDNSYELVVSAGDSISSTDLSVTIIVSDVNEAPVFSGVTEFSVSEGAQLTIVLNTVNGEPDDFLVTDPDGDPVSIVADGEFLSGSDSQLFLISDSVRTSDPFETALISIVKPLDFENPEDADANNVYEFELHVSDGTNSSSISIRVSVTDRTGDTFLSEQGIGAIVGAVQFDGTGSSISFSPDLNGDNVADVLIGAERTTGLELVGGSFGRPGAMHAISGMNLRSAIGGKLDLASEDNTSDILVRWRASISERSPEYGHSIHILDDYDGDGLPEIAIGGEGGGSPPRSDVFIIPGSSMAAAFDDSESTPEPYVETLSPILMPRSASNYGLGWDISSMTDLDGDGAREMLICASDARPSSGPPTFAGSVYVVFSDAIQLALQTDTQIDLDTLIVNNDAVRLDGANGFDSDCTSVSSAGDFDGDNMDDLLIGEGRIGVASQSRAHIIFGAALLLERADDGILRLEDLETIGAGVTVVTDSFLDGFGTRAMGMGDFNNDGFDDIIVGAPRTGVDVSSEGGFGGAAYLLFGSNASFSDPLPRNEITIRGLGFSLQGGQASEETGLTFAPAGDINGDGFDDLFIASPGADALRNGQVFAGSGRIYLVLGGSVTAGTDLVLDDYTAGLKIIGTVSTANIEHLDTSGDIDGDGRSDLLVSATNGGSCNPDGTPSGRGHVYLITSTRILEGLGNDEDLDLNNHLFGGILRTEVPGSGRAECIL